jgi:hypothetical protein
VPKCEAALFRDAEAMVPRRFARIRDSHFAAMNWRKSTPVLRHNDTNFGAGGRSIVGIR